ncbi:hypothetical protein GcM3_c113o26 [Golovinomyces cichoracearum]|uniref:Uncharacterized protein n=1 Tax=Golovinomyces cichoracearum TaxID=62708 RepID=A0A420JA25_9PEZI|nr:hypothetical protein GcM3_c113o26 [Golovinomyces cichoracearum]
MHSTQLEEAVVQLLHLLILHALQMHSTAQLEGCACSKSALALA